MDQKSSGAKLMGGKRKKSADRPRRSQKLPEGGISNRTAGGDWVVVKFEPGLDEDTKRRLETVWKLKQANRRSIEQRQDPERDREMAEMFLRLKKTSGVRDSVLKERVGRYPRFNLRRTASIDAINRGLKGRGLDSRGNPLKSSGKG